MAVIPERYLFLHATAAALNAINTSSDKALDKPAISEIKPITEGPARKPISPPVVTIAKPCTLLRPGILAAALNNTGTIQEQPNPITT